MQAEPAAAAAQDMKAGSRKEVTRAPRNLLNSLHGPPPNPTGSGVGEVDDPRVPTGRRYTAVQAFVNRVRASHLAHALAGMAILARPL